MCKIWYWRYLAQPKHGLPKEPLADAVLAEDLLDPANHLVSVQVGEVVKLKPLLMLWAANGCNNKDINKENNNNQNNFDFHMLLCNRRKNNNNNNQSTNI